MKQYKGKDFKSIKIKLFDGEQIEYNEKSKEKDIIVHHYLESIHIKVDNSEDRIINNDFIADLHVIYREGDSI